MLIAFFQVLWYALSRLIYGLFKPFLIHFEPHFAAGGKKMRHMVRLCTLLVLGFSPALWGAQALEPVCSIDNDRTIEEAIQLIEDLPEAERNMNYAHMGRNINRSAEEVRQIMLDGEYEKGYVAKDEAVLTFGFLPGREKMGVHLRFGRGEEAAYIDDVLVLSAGCCNASAMQLYPRSMVLALQAQILELQSQPELVAVEEEDCSSWVWVNEYREVIYHPSNSFNHTASAFAYYGHGLAWNQYVGNNTSRPVTGVGESLVCVD